MNIRVPSAIAMACMLLSGCGGTDSSPAAALANTSLMAQIVVVNGGASFTGLRSNYVIAKSASGTTVTDRSSGVLQNVGTAQTLKFANATVNLSMPDKIAGLAQADLDGLMDLFMAYFGRVPDADNLPYWIAQFKGGQSLAQLSATFYGIAISAAQTQLTGYSSSMSNTDFIRAVYKNVLGRSTLDQATLDFWNAALALRAGTPGAQTRSSLVQAVLTIGHGDNGASAALLANKLAVAKKFAIEDGLILTTADAVQRRIAIAAAVTATDTVKAFNLIAALTGDAPAPVVPPVLPPAQPGTVGALVTLDGGPLVDANGVRVTFSWALISMPAGSQARLSATNVSGPSFTPDKVGLYLARLTRNGGPAISVPITIGLGNALPAQTFATGVGGVGATVFVARQNGSQLVALETTMVVPAKPPPAGTLFLWPGIQPANSSTFLPINNGVLQPVLTWGRSCAPGVQPAAYSSWWISAQYVNTFGSAPGFTGCHGGSVMAVNVGDQLKITMRLAGTVWTQVVTDVQTGKTVSFAIDMQGQAQHRPEFFVEGIGQVPVGDVEFFDNLFTYSVRDPQGCYAQRRGVNDLVATPTTSTDGASCYLKKITLRK